MIMRDRVSSETETADLSVVIIVFPLGCRMRYLYRPSVDLTTGTGPGTAPNSVRP